MDISLNNLYEGLPCLIKNKEFYATKMYVEPFVDKMSKFTDKFLIQIKEADQLSTINKDINKIYNRVYIQAVLPESHCVDSHDEVIGMLYGIDIKKPLVSFYKGYLNSACTNLTIFNPHWVYTQDLIPGQAIDYSPVKSAIELTSDIKSILKKLKNTTIDRDERKTYLGNWVDNTIRQHLDTGYGKVKISSTHAIEAYKKLFVSQDSEYFIPEGIDPTLFDIYGAFTQIITDDKRDILQKVNKTLLISDILGIKI